MDRAQPPPRLLSRAATLWEPPEDLAPSAWAAKHRSLSLEESDRPGRWRNDVFPYLTAIMDAAREAVDAGKLGVVLMKSAQGGGTQAVLNVAGWAKVRLPGPLAYVCAKDSQAIEMARTRIEPMIRGCKPLADRALWGREHGELVDRKRFADGPWMIVGGRTVTNLEAFPQRVLVFDELDSIQDDYVGKGEPLANALTRTASYSAPTLFFVLAHPTTPERGAGKLYYEESDQRRAFAACPHCGVWFWLQWEHVRAVAREGETQATAEARSDRYQYVTPCCGRELTDAQRWSMADRTEQRSTLAPEEAARRCWIGVHFSALYMRGKSLESLVARWLKARDDAAELRVFVNKGLGDVWREVQQEQSPDAWRACIAPDSYALGQVPRAVQFLTAGQDSRARELHWAVWGWGLVRDSAGAARRVGWLIDCGVIEREQPPGVAASLDAADLAPLDSVLYERAFSRVEGDESLWVHVGLHDSGWQPVAVYAYCLRHPDRSWPSKGAAETDMSTAPPIRPTRTPAFQWGGQTIENTVMQLALLNTYAVKSELVGMLGRTFERSGGRGRQTCIALPVDVPERFLAESAAERKERDGRHWAWKRKGPNHYADCNAYALAAALYLFPGLGEKPREEMAGESRARQAPGGTSAKGAGGDWWSGSRGGRW